MNATIRLSLLAAVLAATPLVSQAEAAPDHSGSLRQGEATVIAPERAGRRMADGGRFETDSVSVASEILPLGTTARLRNLDNGRIAMVRVRDRLPGQSDRFMSVSPMVARDLGMDPRGTTRLEIAPLAVPQPDGSVTLGQGTGMAGQQAHVTRSAPRPDWDNDGAPAPSSRTFTASR